MDPKMEALRLAQTPAPDNPKPSLLNRAAHTLPGIIAGAADLDPAAVLTATVAGASFGVSLGWVVVLCVPVLFSVFAVSSRIGHETRKGLVEGPRALRQEACAADRVADCGREFCHDRGRPRGRERRFFADHRISADVLPG